MSAADVRLLGRFTAKHALVLDIGCGRGGFLATCQGTLRALGLDIRAAGATFWREQQVEALVADGLRMPFRAESFDAVRAKDVIEHLPSPLILLDEAHRILKPKGVLLVHGPSPFSMVYPIANFFDDYTHYRPFTRMGMRRLLEDGGFEVLFLEGYTAGRNRIERALGWLLARVIPYAWRGVARKL